MKRPGEARKVYVHMLNGTMTATERSLCCIVENWQTPEAGRSVSDAEACSHVFLGPDHSTATAAVHARKGVLTMGQGVTENAAEEEAVKILDAPSVLNVSVIIVVVRLINFGIMSAMDVNYRELLGQRVVKRSQRFASPCCGWYGW